MSSTDISSLDFECVPECGLVGHALDSVVHGGPAHALVIVHCPNRCCGERFEMICKPWWDFVTTTTLPGQCAGCGVIGTHDDFYTFVQTVD